MKPEDVMRALEKLKYGGHSCHDCKFAKWKGEDRCGLNGCRIAKAALALLREKDADIKMLTEQNLALGEVILKKDAEIERLKSEAENQSVLWRDHFHSVFQSAKETIRAEAIAEFVAELETHYPHSPTVMNTVRRVAEKMKGI